MEYPVVQPPHDHYAFRTDRWGHLSRVFRRKMWRCHARAAGGRTKNICTYAFLLISAASFPIFLSKMRTCSNLILSANEILHLTDWLVCIISGWCVYRVDSCTVDAHNSTRNFENNKKCQLLFKNVKPVHKCAPSPAYISGRFNPHRQSTPISS
jgi:hypothetical protein